MDEAWRVAILTRFVERERDCLGVPSTTKAELYWNVYNSGFERNVRAMEKFLAPLEVRDFDLAAARLYGQVRTALQRKDTPIGPLDMQIAAHAGTRSGSGDQRSARISSRTRPAR